MRGKFSPTYSVVSVTNLKNHGDDDEGDDEEVIRVFFRPQEDRFHQLGDVRREETHVHHPLRHRLLRGEAVHVHAVVLLGGHAEQFGYGGGHCDDNTSQSLLYKHSCDTECLTPHKVTEMAAQAP